MSVWSRIRPRSRVRRGQPTKKQKSELRLARYGIADGRCELQLHPQCIRGVLPYTGEDALRHGHLVHLKSKGSGGGWHIDNLRWGCFFCHLISLHNPKPCPPKPRPEALSA